MACSADRGRGGLADVHHVEAMHAAHALQELLAKTSSLRWSSTGTAWDYLAHVELHIVIRVGAMSSRSWEKADFNPYIVRKMVLGSGTGGEQLLAQVAAACSTGRRIVWPHVGHLRTEAALPLGRPAATFFLAYPLLAREERPLLVSMSLWTW